MDRKIRISDLPQNQTYALRSVRLMKLQPVTDKLVTNVRKVTSWSGKINTLCLSSDIVTCVYTASQWLLSSVVSDLPSDVLQTAACNKNL